MELIYEYPIWTTWFICVIFLGLASVIETIKK